MQIEKIILYSIHGKKRIINFNLNDVNIITGKSKTGKSVIGEIIDYCLGSRSFNIAIGIVRDTIKCFSLVLKLRNKRIFIARMVPPKGQDSTSMFFYKESVDLHIPEFAELTFEENLETTKYFLSKELGILENKINMRNGSSVEDYQANIRHSLCYCFLKQNVIANKDTLFVYDNPYEKAAIKATMPYFFGAVEESDLALRKEKSDLSREIRILEKKLNEQQYFLKELNINSLKLVLEAKAVGLTEVEISTNTNNQDLLEILKEINISNLEINTSALDNKKITSLQEELKQVDLKVNNLDGLITKQKQFIGYETNYSDHVNHQKQRLESINLFKIVDWEKHCPFCHSENPIFNKQLKLAKDSISVLENNISNLEVSKPYFDKIINEYELERKELIKHRILVKNKLNALFKYKDEVNTFLELKEKRDLVKGKIKFWIDNLPVDNKISTLKNEINKKNKRVDEINAVINDDAVKFKLDSILSKVGFDMTNWAKLLELEHSQYPYRFDYSKFTTIVDKDDEIATLSKLGSASNWLGAHLINFLAFQKQLLLKNRPVPSFLFMDQPSQAYFTPENELKENHEKAEVDRMFNFLLDFNESTNSSLQMIIVDHANQINDNFQSKVIYNWWEDDALIPYEWKEEVKSFLLNN